jgi:hypothetical protein
MSVSIIHQRWDSLSVGLQNRIWICIPDLENKNEEQKERKNSKSILKSWMFSLEGWRLHGSLRRKRS